MILRVYRCPECSHIGYTEVQSQDGSSECSFCAALISDAQCIAHVPTVKEAKRRVVETVYREPKRSKGTHGLGKRRRVLGVVESLVDFNRGRPVTEEAVVQECELAGMERKTVLRFICILKEQDLITAVSGKLLGLSNGGEEW